MIDIPDDMLPNAAQPALLDYGFLQRPATGAALTRIDRPGSRWRIQFTFPVMTLDSARVLIARLTAGKSEGIRLPYPLPYVTQGNPGVPVVDGAVAGGSTLPVRGLSPGYVCKEGYWLSVVDADGQSYLYHAKATAVADASGDASITVSPLLRSALTDGAEIKLGQPIVEGVIDSEISWQMELGGLVSGLGFMLEEAA